MQGGGAGKDVFHELQDLSSEVASINLVGVGVIRMHNWVASKLILNIWKDPMWSGKRQQVTKDDS